MLLSQPGSFTTIVISYCFVDPSFRHQGAGSVMMKWGLEQADAKGMESFVESTEDGEKFYAAHGFETLHDFTLDPVHPKPTEKFSELRSKLLPMHGYVMKRPVGGKKN
jgi:predicted N-acetyltransferase YhbS